MVFDGPDELSENDKRGQNKQVWLYMSLKNVGPGKLTHKIPVYIFILTFGANNRTLLTLEELSSSIAEWLGFVPRTIYSDIPPFVLYFLYL